VWCGVVWCGVVWCGVVWCGVVWCGVVWCGVVWGDVGSGWGVVGSGWGRGRGGGGNGMGWGRGWGRGGVGSGWGRGRGRGGGGNGMGWGVGSGVGCSGGIGDGPLPSIPRLRLRPQRPSSLLFCVTPGAGLVRAGRGRAVPRGLCTDVCPRACPCCASSNSCASASASASVAAARTYLRASPPPQPLKWRLLPVQGSLNAFMGLGRDAWRDARARIQELLSEGSATLRDNEALRGRAFYPQASVSAGALQSTMFPHLPGSVVVS
jgi:hypothetical protein